MRAPVWLVLLAALGGCTFKGGRADPYRCQDGQCPAGLQCQDGLCLAVGDAGAADAPGADAGAEGGVPDAPVADAPVADAPPADAPATDAPATDAPPQEDAAPQEDAPAQQDAPPGCTVDPLTSDAGHFTSVLSAGTWGFGATGYAQTATNDLRTSWVAGAGGDAVAIDANVTVTAQGQNRFTAPAGSYSIAGVMVRASGLSTASMTAYLCGLDSRNGRVVLGRMSGAYQTNQGVLTILAEQALPVTVGTPVAVHAGATGAAITCTAGIATVSASDASIATGSVGLFTIGAAARFQDALYCGP